MGGFDTLDLGVYVDWSAVYQRLQTELNVQRQRAQGKDSVLWRNTAVGSCLVQPSGKKPN